MKKYLAFFLALILFFNLIGVSYADVISDLKDVDIETSIGSFSDDGNIESDTPDEGGNEPETPGGIFSLLWDLVKKGISWINHPLSIIVAFIPGIDNIIYNRYFLSDPESPPNSIFLLNFFENKPGGLSGTIQGACASIYNALRYLTTTFYIIILVYLGIRIVLSSLGRQKARYKELLKYWTIGLLLLFSFHWVMAYAIWLSNKLTDIFWGVMRNSLDTSLTFSFNDLIVGGAGEIFPVMLIPGLSLISLVLDLAVIIVLLVYIIKFMGIYLKRLFTVALLIMLFPLVALSYVFDKIGDRKSQTLGHWLKEFLTNVFIQPIHAMLLTFIIIMLSADLLIFQTPYIRSIIGLLLISIMSSAEKVIKDLFQISSGMGVGKGMGPTSLSNLAHSAQGLTRVASTGKKFVQAGREALPFIKDYAQGAKDYRNNKRAARQDRNSGMMSAQDFKDAKKTFRKDFHSSRRELYHSDKTKPAGKFAGMLGGAIVGGTLGFSNGRKGTLGSLINGANAIDEFTGKGKAKSPIAKKAKLHDFTEMVGKATTNGKFDINSKALTPELKRNLARIFPNAIPSDPNMIINALNRTHDAARIKDGTLSSEEMADTQLLKNAELLDQGKSITIDAFDPANPSVRKPRTLNRSDFYIAHSGKGEIFKYGDETFAANTDGLEGAGKALVFLPANPQDLSDLSSEDLKNTCMSPVIDALTKSHGANPNNWGGELKNTVSGAMAQVYAHYEEAGVAVPADFSSKFDIQTVRSHALSIYNQSQQSQQAPQQPDPSYQAPQQQAPSYQTPQQQAPSYQAPQQQAPSYQTPQQTDPSYQASQQPDLSYQAPQQQAPSYQAPQQQAPSYQASNTSFNDDGSGNDAGGSNDDSNNPVITDYATENNGQHMAESITSPQLIKFRNGNIILIFGSDGRLVSARKSRGNYSPQKVNSDGSTSSITDSDKSMIATANSDPLVSEFLRGL